MATVWLADAEGIFHKETADIMDVPIGTVMSRLHRGRRALEKALHDFGVARVLSPLSMRDRFRMEQA